MKSIFGLTICSFFILVMGASAAKSQTLEAKSLDILTNVTIVGAWQINYAESDNPLLKMQTLLMNKLSQPAEKNSGAKDGALPAMSVSLVPPETLILAGDEKTMTVNENFSEIVFTRTFAVDGVTRRGELQNGTNFSLTASQKNNFLKLETVSPRGNKMIETYESANEGEKLIVIVRFETAQAQEIMTLRRVYDRTNSDIFSDGAEQIQ